MTEKVNITIIAVRGLNNNTQEWEVQTAVIEEWSDIVQFCFIEYFESEAYHLRQWCEVYGYEYWFENRVIDVSPEWERT